MIEPLLVLGQIAREMSDLDVRLIISPVGAVNAINRSFHRRVAGGSMEWRPAQGTVTALTVLP